MQCADVFSLHNLINKTKNIKSFLKCFLVLKHILKIGVNVLDLYTYNVFLGYISFYLYSPQKKM